MITPQSHKENTKSYVAFKKIISDFKKIRLILKILDTLQKLSFIPSHLIKLILKVLINQLIVFLLVHNTRQNVRHDSWKNN